MRFRSAFLTIALLALAACANTIGVAGTPGTRDALAARDALDTPEGAMMIVIDDPRSERRRRGITSPGYTSSLAYQDDPALERAASRIVADHNLTLVSHWPLRNLAVHCLVVEAPALDAMKALGQDARVRWMQPFNEFATQSAALTAPISKDEQFKDEHSKEELAKAGLTAGDGLQRRSIKSLFSTLSEQGAGVKIAVVDTAIDESHPDLSASTVRQTNFAGQRGRPGIEEHGTAVVGLIAASSSNPEGIRGYANEADVRVLRACWQPEGKVVGKCNTLTLALALDAAIDLRPEVLNLSLTGGYDRVLEELLAVLLANGTIVIAAYDDQRSADARFPAARHGVVYAYGAANTHTQPPNYNGTLLSAPRHAMSLAPKAGYDLVSGHSIAAPQISALTARLIERQPDASRNHILSQLTNWLGT